MIDILVQAMAEQTFGYTPATTIAWATMIGSSIAVGGGIVGALIRSFILSLFEQCRNTIKFLVDTV